jgi:hypothetical protein
MIVLPALACVLARKVYIRTTSDDTADNAERVFVINAKCQFDFELQSSTAQTPPSYLALSRGTSVSAALRDSLMGFSPS